MASEITEFYTNSTIFLTGGTGFLGKLVLEKLLRSCPNLTKIYILIREKRSKTSAERFDEIFNEPVWEQLKKQTPNFRNKLAIIDGNCIEPNLGLRCDQIERITNDVDVIMHCAATVRFNEELTRATLINIRAVGDLIKIARKTPKLRAFVHVSTAYSNCNRHIIEEKFYEPSIMPSILIKLVENFDNDALNHVSDKFLGEFPNTYTFTKHLGEFVVQTEGAGLPIAVIRPSIIAGTYDEPIRGYIDKPFGFSGSVQGIIYGFLRCLFGEPKIKTDLIPGDFVANNIIAAGWAVGTANNNGRSTQIYHCTSSGAKKFTVRNYVERIVALSRTKLASNQALWYPFCFVVSSERVFKLAWFVLHTLPAWLVYFGSVVTRKNAKRTKLLRLYKKSKKLTSILGYFMSKQWEFRNDNCKMLFNKQMNVVDREIFNFNVASIDWDLFLERQITGIRLHLARERNIAVDGEVRMRKLRFLHFLFVFLSALGIGGLLWKLPRVLFR